MIGGDDARKGTGRCDQEGFEWEGKLVEGRIAASGSNDTEGPHGKATKTAQDAALKGGSGREGSEQNKPIRGWKLAT